MIEIQNLLTQISLITKKNNEILDSIGGRFNMFGILGVDHYENTHSAIIREFLNPQGSHGLKDQLLKAFIELLTLHDQKCVNFGSSYKTETAHALTEYPTSWGRIDILIEDNSGHAIIIENKIYAEDQWEQLKRYNEYALEKYKAGNYLILYLTLNGVEASVQSSKDIDYIQISHAYFIKEWLEKCVSLAVQFSMVRETIVQYINHLKRLTNMNTKSSEEIVEIISKPENIEAAFSISENIMKVKHKLLSDMSEYIAKKLSLKPISFLKNNVDGIGFSKEEWKHGTIIYFAYHNGKTYYSIKTKEALNGKSKSQDQINELFDKKVDAWNPYGYGYVRNDHWETNNQLYLKIADKSLAEETIIPSISRILEYLEKHPEIEERL